MGCVPVENLDRVSKCEAAGDLEGKTSKLICFHRRGWSITMECKCGVVGMGWLHTCFFKSITNEVITWFVILRVFSSRKYFGHVDHEEHVDWDSAYVLSHLCLWTTVISLDMRSVSRIRKVVNI